MAGGERVADEAGERRFGDDGKLRRRGEMGTDQRRAREDERIGRRKRLDTWRRIVVEQARSQADAAEECAQAGLGEIVPRARARGQIDMEKLTVKSVQGQPPASAETIKILSPERIVAVAARTKSTPFTLHA